MHSNIKWTLYLAGASQGLAGFEKVQNYEFRSQ